MDGVLSTTMSGETIAANFSLIELAAKSSNLTKCDHGSLTGPWGLVLQFGLAFLAFCSLIVKRFCEPKRTRRSWRIWFFDTSKQGFGQVGMHFANVYLADAFRGDPCTWYLVSFLLDSTVGLLFIWIGLKLSQMIITRYRWSILSFGEYGTPPEIRKWLAQSLLYMLVMLITKIFITLIMQFNFWDQVRQIILYPIKDPQVEIAVVMFIVPLVVNTIIFWVVDNFLKKSIKETNVYNPKYRPIHNESDAEFILDERNQTAY